MKHQYNYGMLGGGQICRTNDKEGLVFTCFFFCACKLAAEDGHMSKEKLNKLNLKS